MRSIVRLINALMGIFFRLLYHQLAWSYDLVAAVVSAGQWQHWVLATVPYLKGPRVLEVGHGPGHLQAALWAQGVCAVGLDESVQMGRQAARRLERKALEPRLARGLVQALPFPDSSFEQVAATFPTNYIYDSRSLAEIYRVLAPGGQLVVLPSAVNTGHSLPALFGRLLYRVFLHSETNPTHPALETWFLAPLQQAGFQTELNPLTLKNSKLVLILAKKNP